MSAGDGSETIGSSYDETHMGETPTWNIPDNVTGSQAEEVQPQPFTYGSDYPHYPQPPQNPPRSTPNLLSFNWGGFLLGWIWGISNHVYWSLSSLMLSIVFYLLIGIWIAEDFHGVNPGELAMLLTVTVLGKFVIRLILGISGNRMAWQSKKFTSIEEFERIQKGWNVASIIIYSIAIGVGIVLLSQA